MSRAAVVTLSLPRKYRRRIGRAMADYAMLADGDRVLVAVSGGADSLVLAWLLDQWRRRAPIDYQLAAIHIDMEPEADGAPGPGARLVRKRLARLGLDCVMLPADNPAPAKPPADTDDFCFRCARGRRTQLFAHARDHGYNRLALGHHRDDIITTFFLNLIQAGNISTMRPRQDLFSGRLALIRPLAYLEKREITRLARQLDLEPVASRCPLSEHTSRQRIEELVARIEQGFPGAGNNIFAALGNVRLPYLLNQHPRHAHPS